MKFVSIIIPVYNGDIRLAKIAIDSACNQTYPNKEIIIIDDGSNNDMHLFLDRYKIYDYVKIYHKINEGVSVARNQGINLSQGDYIFFMDSDDYIEPLLIEKLIRIQDKYDSDITGCLYYIFDDKNKRSIYDGPDIQIYNEYNMDKFRILMFSPTTQKGIYYPYCMCVWGKLIRKSIIIDSEIFFNSKLILSEDLLFMNQISYFVNKIVIVSDELYGYRENNISVTHRYSKDYYQKIINTLNLIQNELDLSNHEIKKYFNIYRLLFMLNIIKFYIVNEEHKCSYLQKRKELVAIRNFFNRDLNSISLIPLKYQLYLYLLRYKCYDLAYIVALCFRKSNDIRRRKT